MAVSTTVLAGPVVGAPVSYNPQLSPSTVKAVRLSNTTFGPLTVNLGSEPSTRALIPGESNVYPYTFGRGPIVFTALVAAYPSTGNVIVETSDTGMSDFPGTYPIVSSLSSAIPASQTVYTLPNNLAIPGGALAALNPPSGVMFAPSTSATLNQVQYNMTITNESATTTTGQLQVVDQNGNVYTSMAPTSFPASATILFNEVVPVALNFLPAGSQLSLWGQHNGTQIVYLLSATVSIVHTP